MLHQINRHLTLFLFINENFESEFKSQCTTLAWRRLVAHQHLDDLWLSTWSVKQPFLRSFVLYHFGISLLKRWFFWAFMGVATIIHKSPWVSNAVFIFFCHFWVSSWNSLSLACEQALGFGKGWKKLLSLSPTPPSIEGLLTGYASFLKLSCSSSSPTLFKVQTGKKSCGYTYPTLFVGWGEGLGAVWIGKHPRNAKVSQGFYPWF